MTSSALQGHWSNKFISICNAPIRVVELEELDPVHPAALFLPAFEELKSENTGTPHRRQLTPSRYRDFLRWLFIFEREVGPEENRFIVRLEGTSVVELTHHDYTGRFLDEFTNNNCYTSRFKVLEQVCGEGTPVFARVTVSDPATAEYKTDVSAGFFPFLAGKDDERQQVVAVLAPQDADLRSML